MIVMTAQEVHSEHPVAQPVQCDRQEIPCPQSRGASLHVAQPVQSVLGPLKQGDSPVRQTVQGTAQKVKQQRDPPTVLLAPCDRPTVPCSQRRGASMLVTQPANSAMGHLDHSDSPARKADREKDRGTVQQGAMRSVKFAVQLAQCDRPSTLCSQSRGASMHVTQPVRSASESMDHRALPVAREGAEGVAHGKKEHKAATEGREASAVVEKKEMRECGAARATKGRPAGSNPLGGNTSAALILALAPALHRNGCRWERRSKEQNANADWGKPTRD